MDGRPLRLDRGSFLALSTDIAIIGGGITGCALARALRLKVPSLRVALLEKEPEVGCHASGRNSGVIHSGINAPPGTLKARFAVEGNRRLREYCQTKGILYRACGTLVVATSREEMPRLGQLFERAKTNGVPEIEMLERPGLLRYEPHAGGIAALLAPTGSIVDSRAVVRALAQDATQAGAELITETRVLRVLREEGRRLAGLPGFRLETTRGALEARFLVNCAGIYADRIAHQLDAGCSYRMVPFRGEYFELVPRSTHLVRSMIYPVPDFRFPFLGIHLTRTVQGAVLAGPNAVLALGREAYGRDLQNRRAGLENRRTGGWNLGDLLDMGTHAGFWRLLGSRAFWDLARKEVKTSFSREAFLDRARRLLPELRQDDILPSQSAGWRTGIRAQLVKNDGALVDDFVVEEQDRALHVLNVVSPGFTCALPLADFLAEKIAATV